ncbi:hypothetical protein V6N13_036905 [Hibiscus sabdariffa]
MYASNQIDFPLRRESLSMRPCTATFEGCSFSFGDDEASDKVSLVSSAVAVAVAVTGPSPITFTSAPSSIEHCTGP